MKNLIHCLLTFCITLNAFAQQSKEPTFTVRAGIALTSTAVYNITGTDTSFKNQLAVAPTISLLHSNGFAIDYAPYFLTSGAQPGIYMHALTLGYEQYDGKTFTVRTGYTHYFFTANKSVPYSPITNELYFATDYKKLWLRPALSLGYGFGQDQAGLGTSDFYAGIGVKHSFDFENTGIFSSIDLGPSVFLNGGTNKYYSYLSASKYLSRSKNAAKATSQNGRGRGNGNGGSGSGSATTTSTSGSNAFALNNLELGLWSDFVIQQVHLKPQGSLYIPVRSGNNLSGYWQVNLEYYF